MSITRINNNVAAVNANFNLARNSRSLEKSVQRLSSGLRINRAGDDAAGMTIATRLRSQVRGLDRAIMNAQDGINVINVAEAAMEEMITRLDRIRVLAVQAGNTGVNDFQARQALQDEVFQSIDEITRIADTSQFSKNRLLNGDFSVKSEIKPGQDGAQNFGIKIDHGPSSSTLESGLSFLNIVQTKEGYAQLLPGLDSNGVTRTMHMGVQDATDIAVSFAHFSDSRLFAGTGSASADLFSTEFFNGVSIHVSASTNVFDVFVFDGVLSDGKTKYNGSLSLRFSSNVNFLISSIRTAIDTAERSLFGVTSNNSVPTAFRTEVTLSTAAPNAGRIQFVSAAETHNQSDLNVRLLRNGNLVTQATGVTRSGAIGTNSLLTGQGQVGNSVSAITGTTFDTGQFNISVEDVQGAQNRTVEGSVAFRDKNGSIISRTASLTNGNLGLSLNGNFVNGVYTNGVSIVGNDTITLRGIEADGTSFMVTYTLSNVAGTDTDLNDFQFATLSGLISELNYRTRDYTNNTLDGTLTRFESALFTITASGVMQLVDDIGRDNSQIAFTLTFNDSAVSTTPAYTIQDRSVLKKEGFSESATFRINGGPPVRAKAGDVVTLVGPEATRQGDVQDKVIVRVGSNLRVGTDFLDVEQKEYIGSLNGGPAVTFQNGAQDVVFVDDSSYIRGVARILTVDFDDILDITKSPDAIPDPGTTILISTVNSSMNFQIGAFANQNFRTSIGDLTAQNLGFGKGSGRTIEDIDIRTVSGANEALRIVDEALDQINRTRSLLGAATNRLEGTIASLSVSSENLLASESRLRDADIAKESTEFTKNQILLQAGTTILAQANFLPQSLLSLLGG